MSFPWWVRTLLCCAFKLLGSAVHAYDGGVSCKGMGSLCFLVFGGVLEVSTTNGLPRLQLCVG